MNKQIEEMAKEIARICLETHDTDCYERKCEDCRAIYLHNHGYRKSTDVAREIFKEIENILFSLVYLDFDGKYHLRKMNGDRVTEIFERYYKIKKKYESEGADDEVQAN